MNGVRYKFVEFVLFVAIIVTIITQLPFFVERDLNICGVIIWIPLFLCVLFLNAFKMNTNICIPVACFGGYLFFLLLFNSLFYVFPVSSCIKGFSISMSMFLLGYYLANIIKEGSFIKAIVYAALIGGSVFSIIIKNTVFYVVDLDSISYLYQAKNSASKIIFTCFILVLFLYIPKLKITIFLKYITLSFFIYMILIMKSRSTILALVVPAFAVLYYSKNKYMKKYVCIFLSVVVLLSVCFPYYPELVFNKIFLNNQIDADLNTISTGRLWMIENFFMIFNDYALIGGSSTFVENFYLITLLQVGIIGATPVFLFLLWFYFVLRKYFDFANPIDISCLILLLVYYMDGLFEAMAPFGPGAKCFFLWLIIGFFINKRIEAYNKFAS
ncbi:hypothetical protein [Parabacteroides sp. AF17-28]|uniref:O-antigen ligase family protein n=1 Tax=Parabacteroides sp. AF17-28 TaxID=2292241 RepID=UPI0011C47C22|nr:hypothetical protein [Parabacteroides sp. AF17-28]